MADLLRDEFKDKFLKWFQGSTVSGWKETDAPDTLADIAYNALKCRSSVIKVDFSKIKRVNKMDTSRPEQLRYSYLYRKESDDLYVVTIPALKYKGMFHATDEDRLKPLVYSKVRHLLTLIALKGDPFLPMNRPMALRLT